LARLAGKIAFITGIGTGIGRAAARLFTAEGAIVAGCDIDAERAEETLAQVEAAGGQLLVTAPVDLADSSAARDWIDAAVERCGGIDILYNNAGAVRFASLDAMTDEDWRFTLRNELDLVFHTIRAAWPHMVARGGGAIVNTASTVTRRGNPAMGFAAHTAAKSGVLALTRQVAAEGARHGIRANSISPGLVQTPATEHLQPFAEDLRKSIPLGRWGVPEDIVRCALYLASDEASWVTAADFAVDGGISGAL
jgi:NAD(P)-dependent dehydrogenase (short-subunit alcohol dehydrogenase family)